MPCFLAPVTSVFLELVLADTLVRLSSRCKVAKGNGCLSWVVLLAVPPNRSAAVVLGQCGEPFVTALNRPKRCLLRPCWEPLPAEPLGADRGGLEGREGVHDKLRPETPRSLENR